MELRSLQSDLGGDADHLLERGIEENADQRDLRGQRVANRLRLRDRDAAPARSREDHPDLVGSFARAEERIGHGAYAAELDLHACTSARVALCGSAAAMSRMASAPYTRASRTWNSVTMKSLRSSGNDTAARAARRSSREPPKCTRSVSTEIAAAPPRAYACASCAGSRRGLIAPLDGLLRFTSAIRPARGNGRSGGASAGKGSFSRSRASATACATSFARWVIEPPSGPAMP